MEKEASIGSAAPSLLSTVYQIPLEMSTGCTAQSITLKKIERERMISRRAKSIA